MAAEIRIVAWTLMLVILTACGSFQRNPQLVEFNPAAGYRFGNLALGPGNSDDLFVVVSFSGGGTRAAAMAYGVMKTLESTRIQWNGEEKSLLDEVDMITSVSGGSFTSGYYALHGKEIFDGRFEEVFLNRNIEGKLLGQLLNPINLFNLLGGRSYSRSDLAADYYDQHIFNGATWADLALRYRRPYVMINATDMTMGAQFQFIQDQFDLLCSNLDGVHLARAVATSSAFPGLLSPLTYANYANQGCNFTDSDWVSNAESTRRTNAQLANLAETRRSYYSPDNFTGGWRDYIHLIDGGVIDNIGLRGLILALEYEIFPYSLLQKFNNEEIDKLLMVVVNGASLAQTDRDNSSSVPGLFDNIFRTASVPVDRVSEDTIELIRATVDQFNSDYEILQQCTSLIQDACPASGVDLGELHAVDLYISEVSFDYIADPERRRYFQNIPTNFNLSPEVNAELFEVACNLLTNDPELQLLLSGDRGFSDTAVTGELSECPE